MLRETSLHSPAHSPLASQSWKETVPSCLVSSPPPQGKHPVRPGSGWYVPTGQAWQGLKPSGEKKPGEHWPGSQRSWLRLAGGGRLGPDPALNPHLPWGRAPRLGVVLGGRGDLGEGPGLHKADPPSGCCQRLRHYGALARRGFTSPTSKKGYGLKSKWLCC